MIITRVASVEIDGRHTNTPTLCLMVDTLDAANSSSEVRRYLHLTPDSAEQLQDKWADRLRLYRAVASKRRRAELEKERDDLVAKLKSVEKLISLFPIDFGDPLS